MARTARNFAQILQDLNLAAAGAERNAATVVLLQNTPAAILATRELLIGRPANGVPAQVGVITAWTHAKTAKVTTSAAHRAALNTGRELALTCISTLKHFLGRTWNTQWIAAGFINGSRRVPKTPTAILINLGNYYASNPNREVTNPGGLNCTAAACRTAVAAIQSARASRNTAKVKAQQAKRALAAGLKTARQRLIGVRAELTQLLPSNDSRWITYGIQKPAYRPTPPVPEDLTVTNAGPGALLYRWTDAPRAESYRIILTDTAGKVLLEEIVKENFFTISSPLRGEDQGEGNPSPTGLVVTATVSARNQTGESPPTAPVTATVE